MKVVVQRVQNANVTVKNKKVGEINKGLLLLVGFTQNETQENIDWMVKKITNLRIFDDQDGIMNISIKDIKGEILSVSQFTLYADSKKGNRPSYIKALNGEEAIILYNKFNKKLKETGLKVEEGIFGEDMQVSLTNDGPITIILEK